MQCALLLALGTPGLAQAQPHEPLLGVASQDGNSIAAEIADRAASQFRGFYAERGHRPLWLGERGATAEAHLLLQLLESADLDGLKPRKLGARKLGELLEKASGGDAGHIARAELAFSKAYANYVKALRKLTDDPMIRESDALRPVAPTPGAALEAAAAEPSLLGFLRRMGWMHPLYAPMREAMADPRYTPAQRAIISANLERVRLLPPVGKGRHVLVDVAGARLWMYDGGEPVDTMRVVVGRPDEQTPMMAGFLRYAIVNPYWNVPEDLVRKRIAANVVTRGLGYLRAGGYQVLSDWSETPQTVDPARIDWRAVLAGAPPPRVRQLPGKENFMGKVKFMFPNRQGIYLHDTPDRHLMLRQGRQFSSGCVRLEHAGRFGRWLLGKPLPHRVRKPEQEILLPEPVPVLITYLTALPTPGGVAFNADAYGQDASRLALSGSSR